MTNGNDQGWYLEGFLDGQRVARRFDLRVFPALVGRAADADVTLPVSQVSTRHAELFLAQGRPWLRDLGSSNGTFVNREPVTDPVALNSGDVVHFGDAELLLGRESGQREPMLETCVMTASPAAMATGAHSLARALRTLLAQGEVDTAFQPIVSLGGAQDLAFEILGRGTRAELPDAPGPLFGIAEESGLAADLSRAFRRVGLHAALAIPGSPRIYTNVHPSELADDTFIRELSAFRERAPALPLTVEVHESTVTDARAMRRLRSSLSALQVGLAYDDFGAGQARLLELADCPPDCLKFDMSLIRDIDTAPESRQRMVETLVGISTDLGVDCLAEGIERAGELETCRAMGFGLAQGYFIARPAPLEQWRSPWRWAAHDEASSAGESATR